MSLNKIVTMEFGSHVYGTNIETSDKDYKGIYIPPFRDIILGRTTETFSYSNKPKDQLKNDENCVDEEIFSLKQYLKLLLEGQTVALTMLFVPEKHLLQQSGIWMDIQDNKSKFLHKGVSAFAGYCRTQANKYGIKGSRVAAVRLAKDFFEELILRSGAGAKLKEHWDLVEQTFKDEEHCEFLVEPVKVNPGQQVRMLSVCGRKVQEHITLKEAHRIFKHVFDEYGQRALAAEKNEGIDWKALMHAVRVCNEAEELLSTGNITYPSPIASTLLKIRKGELKYEEVANLIEEGLVNLERASSESSLPEKPDYQFAEDLLYNTYLSYDVEPVELVEEKATDCSCSMYQHSDGTNYIVHKCVEGKAWKEEVSVEESIK